MSCGLLPLAGPTPWGHQLTDKGFPFIPLAPKPLLGGCSCSLAEERASSRRAPKGLLLLLLQKCPQPSPARQPSGSGRGGGKAIDLDILAGSRPQASARDDSIHRDTRLTKKTESPKAQPRPSDCSPGVLSCAFTRAWPTASPLTHIPSFFQKSVLKHGHQQPVRILMLIIILLSATPGHSAIKRAEWASKDTSQPGQKNIITPFILSPCQYNMQHYLFNGLIILNYSFLQH